MTGKTEFLQVEDQAKVRVWREKWDAVLQESVIVKVHVWKWHPFARLNPDRMEKLGVHFGSEEARRAFQSVMRSGSIDLIPRVIQNRITSAETGSRKVLKDMTIEVMWGNLLPATAYETWKAKHTEYENEFWDAVNYIYENLRDGDCLLDQMKAEYRTIFSDTWSRLSSMGDSSEIRLPSSQEEFIQEAIKDLSDSVPSNEAVKGKYRFETSFLDAPMSDEIAEAEARAAQIRAESLNSNESMEKEHRKIVEEMRAKVASQTESRRAEVERSLAMAENAFYQGVLEVVNNINDSIAEKGKVGGRIGLQLRNLAEKVRTLNVFDDSPLKSQVDSLVESLEARNAAAYKDKGMGLQEIQAGLADTSAYIIKQMEALPSRRGIRVISSDQFEVEDTDSVKRVVSTESVDVPMDDSVTVRR